MNLGKGEIMDVYCINKQYTQRLLAADGFLWKVKLPTRLLLQRTPPADLPYWLGRRTWAALDAAGWPLAWIAATLQLHGHGGVFGAAIIAAASIAAAGRVRRAIWKNHRYVFTTWPWMKVVMFVVLLTAIMKATL